MERRYGLLNLQVSIFQEYRCVTGHEEVQSIFNNCFKEKVSCYQCNKNFSKELLKKKKLDSTQLGTELLKIPRMDSTGSLDLKAIHSSRVCIFHSLVESQARDSLALSQ